MNLLTKLLCSLWFWLDVVLSITGGIIVYWGLMIEKRAEKRMPPSDFEEDIFDDVIALEKSELERGWKILMIGIAFEVIAALGISVISGLEIADLNDKSAAAILESKQAEKVASQAIERAAITESNNLVLQAKLQPRIITPKKCRRFHIFNGKNHKKNSYCSSCSILW